MKKTLWRLVLPVCLTAAAAQAQEAKLIVIGDEAQTENAVSVAGDGQVSPATAAVSQEQEKTAAPVSDNVEGKTVSVEQSAGNSSENAVSGAVPGDNSEEGDASAETNRKNSENEKVSGAAEQQGEKTAVGTEAGTDAGKTPAEQAEGAEPQAESTTETSEEKEPLTRKEYERQQKAAAIEEERANPSSRFKKKAMERCAQCSGEI